MEKQMTPPILLLKLMTLLLHNIPAANSAATPPPVRARPNLRQTREVSAITDRREVETIRLRTEMVKMWEVERKMEMGIRAALARAKRR